MPLAVTGALLAGDLIAVPERSGPPGEAGTHWWRRFRPRARRDSRPCCLAGAAVPCRNGPPNGGCRRPSARERSWRRAAGAGAPGRASRRGCRRLWRSTSPSRSISTRSAPALAVRSHEAGARALSAGWQRFGPQRRRLGGHGAVAPRRMACCRPSPVRQSRSARGWRIVSTASMRGAARPRAPEAGQAHGSPEVRPATTLSDVRRAPTGGCHLAADPFRKRNRPLCARRGRRTGRAKPRSPGA